jgi:preprotein translocase subunit YajC
MNSFYLSLLAGAPQGGEGGPGSSLFSFLPLVVIIGIFYFLILRPQNKKQKETKKMLSALKKGDRVVSIGGIHGVIQSVKENTVIVKVDENVKLEFNRGAIATVTNVARDDSSETKSEDKDKTQEDDEK